MFEALFEDARKKRQEPPADDVQSKGQTKKKRPRPTKKQKPTTVAFAKPHDSNDSKKPPKRPRRRGPPSPEALELSRQLKELSRHKRLPEALRLYRGQSSLTDEHHACIVVDCCGRCGAMEDAQAIVDALPPPINIETQTALLKGYASAGRMEEAMHLFRRLMAENDKNRQPNVRTLNTLLRGCLWTCATVRTSKEAVVGGVVSSEAAWVLCDANKKHQPAQDPSAVEYSVSLLCQALRVSEALERVDAFLKAQSIQAKGKAKFLGGDQIALETLAVVYSKLATSYALLGEKDQVLLMCQKSLSANRLSKAMLLEDTSAKDTSSQSQGAGKAKATGGKQSWKSADKRDSRSASNTTFRSHRLDETEADVKQLLQHREKVVTTATADTLIQLLTNQCFLFSGGVGSKEHSKEQRKSVGKSLLTPLWHSFGLRRLLLGREHDITTEDVIFQKYAKGVASLVGKDGMIKFDQVFGAAKQTQPLEIEVGSGFGSWIVDKAREHPQTNYIAVELRADRVFSTISRAMLHGGSGAVPKNLCIVGSECGAFLAQRVAPGTVTTFYANHPEPPTQTMGMDHNSLHKIASGGAEPPHMLTSTAIAAMGLCLRPAAGKIFITTDNRNFARLMLATVRKVTRQKNSPLRSLTPEEGQEQHGLQHVDTFDGTVHLFQHQQRKDGGSSYFDRLWRSGGSHHAERTVRFCVALRRV